MVEAIICGTDAHDNTLTCCIGVGRETPEVRKIKNTLHGREWLSFYLKDLARQNGGSKIVTAYEASTLGFGIHDGLVHDGIESHILAPTKMPKAAKDRKNKTDERDARRIFEMLRAHVLAGNELPDIWIPDHQTRDDRETVRARLDVGKKLTTIKTQVQTLLKRNGVVKPEEAGNSWTKSYRKWLRDFELPKGSRNALSSLLRQIACLEQEIKILDREVVALSETDRYDTASRELVERIKGVGLLTAMVFLTELGDMNRFNNRKEVGSFLGLVPSSNESGETDDRKGHITREGPARVRRVLCQATWSRVANDEREAEVYNRIAEKNPKHKKIAVVASMRRLGVLMWHIAKDAQRKAASLQIQDDGESTTYAMRA